MKEEAIIRARQFYRSGVCERNNQIDTVNDLVSLYNDGRVNISIIEREKKNIPSDRDIIMHSISNIDIEDFDDDIYVFMGAFVHGDKTVVQDVLIPNEKQADYLLYLSLESEYVGKVIKTSEQKQFEESHTVLKIDNVFNREELKNNYRTLQHIYFKELLSNEEITKDKVLEKVKVFL